MTTAPTQTRIEEAIAVGRAGFISHFTPSMMIPQVLEDIFVGRDELAAELVEQIESSAFGEAKQHTLLIGPRGIGKSHLIALTYYRVKENPQVSERLRIAWLHEEEYGVTSWLDLLLRIFRALEEEYPDTTPQEQLEALYYLKTAEAEREAERLLREYIGDRTLLLLIENLDEVFEGLKDKGQRQWRAFLQQYPICATLATSPSLFNGVSRQTSPFYGFFRVRNLEPLTVETAVNLLQKLALYRGDKELAEFIATPAGRARVRAVHHLAGGNHRIYVIFSQFLDRRSLDELVGPFLNMLDELTPYYQSRMFLLSPQQRKMVEVLCAQRGAVTVKVLAHRGFMSQQTASSQLQDLRDKGYAVPHVVGRESFYELREPMMRLCLEVKKQRGEPIGLFVQFLRVWYSREQLQEQIELLPSERHFERQYLTQAIEGLSQKEQNPAIKSCIQDFKRLYALRNIEAAFKVTDELLALRGNASDWTRRGNCLIGMGKPKEASSSFTQALARDENYAPAYYGRSWVYWTSKQHKEALSDLDKCVEVLKKVKFQVPSIVFFFRGKVLGALGHYEQALQDFRESFKLKLDSEDQAEALALKGLTLAHLGRYGQAVIALQSAERRGFTKSWLYSEMGRALFIQGDFVNAISYLNLYINEEADKKQSAPSVALRSFAAKCIQNFNLALSDAEYVLSTLKDDPFINSVRTEALLALGRWEEGIKAFQENLSTLGQQDSFDSTTIPLANWHFWAFKCQPNLELWTARCHELTNLYNHLDAITVLEQGIVEISSSLAQSLIIGRQDEVIPVEEQTVCDWLEAWKRGSKDYPELALPLRLSEAAINFAIKKDVCILLALPVEERRVVQDMLNLDTEQAESISAPKPRRTTKPKQTKRTKAPAKPKSSTP